MKNHNFLTNSLINVKQSWKSFLNEEFKKDYFYSLQQKIEQEYNSEIVYPKKEDIFRCLTFFEIQDTNLVILGQDPYHVENMADGLAFSTKLNIVPKSLNNIFKELENDFNIKRTNCDLTDIASQNVLLLNTILTVQKNHPLSHKGYGWEILTKNLINHLSKENKTVIYLLMGKNAWEYEKYINNSLKIIKTSHPSPFSYRISLQGSKTFLTINNILKENNKQVLKW